MMVCLLVGLFVGLLRSVPALSYLSLHQSSSTMTAELQAVATPSSSRRPMRSLRRPKARQPSMSTNAPTAAM